MQSLVKAGFRAMTDSYGDATKALVEQGKYDLVSHFDNETIMPSLWDSVLEPGMTIRMAVYPFPPSTQPGGPHSIPHYGTQHPGHPYDFQPCIHGSILSPTLATPSSKHQTYVSREGDDHNPRDENTKTQNEIHDDDDMTPTVSTNSAQRGELSTSNANVARSRSRKSADKTQTVTWASSGDKPRKNKTTTPSSKPGDLGAHTKTEDYDTFRPGHRQRALPSSSSLPVFEDLGIEKTARRSAARPVKGRDSSHETVSMGYINSTYGSRGSTVSSYPYPNSSYSDQPNVPIVNSAELVPRRTLSYDAPMMAARSLEQQPTQPQDSEFSRAFSELKQMFLDDKATREAKEKKLEHKKRAKAEKEHLVAAAVAAAAANAKLAFAEKEAEKLAMEEERAEAEAKSRMAAVAAAANPEPVHLKDCLGRKFTFPFERCSTWQVCSLGPALRKYDGNLLL